MTTMTTKVNNDLGQQRATRVSVVSPCPVSPPSTGTYSNTYRETHNFHFLKKKKGG